jgi:hypothetical protein
MAVVLVTIIIKVAVMIHTYDVCIPHHTLSHFRRSSTRQDDKVDTLELKILMGND